MWPTPNAFDGVVGSILNEKTEFIKKGNVIRKLSNTGSDFSISLGRVVQLWPAGPGEQYDWEPPRITTELKDRVNRLKCLGNAVVPQQVYPILKAIADVEVKEEGVT